jgi:two-component system, sensor histidine kinase and response regulator
VVGDPVRLGQVLMNLVANAIKFSPAGRIDVMADLETQDRDSSVVRFTIADMGIGIDSDKHSLIFEAFRQADGSTTRRYGGTGLGLSICKHLVEMMGGRIWVESTPGQGSRFHFTVRFGRSKPVAVVEPAVPVLASQPVRQRGEERIRAIVIHSDESRRAHLAAVLEGWNIETAVVNCAASALDVIRWSVHIGRSFAFAVAGKEAACENGRTLAAGLEHEQANLPLIVISDEGDGLQEPSAAACLSWPVSQSSLLEAVFRYLRPGGAGHASDPTRASAQPVCEMDGLRILAAEDIPENQELLRALFDNEKAVLRIVNNGSEAVQAFRRESFDVILMDIQMPEMSGLEATAMIRRIEHGSGARVPIIALTAHAMKGDRERYLESDMDGYVSKPIRPAELFGEIDRVVGARALAGVDSAT